MDTVAIFLLLASLVLAAGAFRFSLSMGWHWGVAVVLALIPVTATFFFGILGLLGAALFVGALFKASAT